MKALQQLESGWEADRTIGGLGGAFAFEESKPAIGEGEGEGKGIGDGEGANECSSRRI